MNLASVYYFLFLIICFIVYYLVPGKMQKYVLTIASLYFFLQMSSETPEKFLMILSYVILVTYAGGLITDRLDGRLRTACTAVAIVLLVSVLVILKYLYNITAVVLQIVHISSDISWMDIVAPIGISYFTLSAIGYLMEVFWKNIQAEKNLFNVALFVAYFPQIISGPVTRYPEMKQQFDKAHSLEYENIAKGALRMLWGYFQKFVISERFSVVVLTIYGNIQEQSGISIILATLCYAIQLYTDFSGCMDIIMGTSILFDIKLPENFRAPFFSFSIQEFWQRWHITLGLWFKDYIMYPLQLTKPFLAIGRICGKRFGKKAGRKISFYSSMLVLWTLIGIWHGGTGYYFIASAGIPCILLIISDLLNPYCKKAVIKLKIKTDCYSYRLFQRIRTVLLVCLSWIFVCANGTYNGIAVYKQVIKHFILFSSPEATFELFGFELVDIVLMVLGICILFTVDYIKDTGRDVLVTLREQNIIFKYAVIACCILTVMYYGKVGNSTFIYFKF